MAGLHELRFTEEKPLLRGQDAELENSDVFLSTVDADWKVGPAMGGAAHPWVSHGTAAFAWERLWGTE